MPDEVQGKLRNMPRSAMLTAEQVEAGEGMSDTEAPNFLHPVRIAKVDNGFIVKVGCKTFVSPDWEAVCVGLELYWLDPREAEAEYCNK